MPETINDMVQRQYAGQTPQTQQSQNQSQESQEGTLTANLFENEKGDVEFWVNVAQLAVLVYIAYNL